MGDERRVGSSSVPDGARRGEDVDGRGRRRRGRSGVVAVTLAVLLVGALAAAVSRLGGGAGRPPHVGRSASPPRPTPAASWGPLLAPAPIAGRSGHSAVLGGGTLLVWGGADASGELGDGAVYDLSTRRWRVMAPSPVAARAEHVAFWDGHRMLVWGGHTDRGRTPLADGAFYDPVTDAWTRLPSAPLRGRRDAAAAWTGVDLLVYGGAAGDGAAVRTFADGAAYDSERGSWRTLPRSPLGERWGAASAMFDGTWLVWGGFAGENPVFDGAIYDGASWARLPPLPAHVRPPERPVALWTGDEVLVLGSDRDGAVIGIAYRPATAAWRALPPAPFAGWEFADVVWAGDRVVAWAGDTTFGYRPGAEQWTAAQLSPLAPRAGGSLVWSGSHVVVWGGTSLPQPGGGAGPRVFHADGAAYSPTAAGR